MKTKFPKKLYAHQNKRLGVVQVSTDSNPEESGAIIAEIPNDERGRFAIELCRRWNQKKKKTGRLPTSAKEPRFCYALLPSELADKSIERVSVIIVKEGESGYYPTAWKWLRKNAEQCRDEKNAALGITPEEAEKMLLRSLFPKTELTLRIGRELFRFRHFREWTDYATDYFQSARENDNVIQSDILCLDAKGRPCTRGSHFKQAQEDDAFPIIGYAVR